MAAQAVLDPTERVLTEPLAEVVKELVDTLGGPNVAVIGGVNKTSTVGDWMRGRYEPKEDRERRLRLALRMARTIKARFGDKTVRAWFWGANTRFKDESPIAILSAQPLEKFEKALLGAARAVVGI